MTNSIHKTPRLGVSKATANHLVNQDDDLILADLDPTTDDSALKITPLRHWQDDENDLEQLLARTGSNEDAQTKADANWSASQSEPTEQMVEIANSDNTDVLQAEHPDPTSTRIEPSIGVMDEYIETPSPELFIPTTELTQPTDKTDLFEITPFIASYLAVRQDLQAKPDSAHNTQVNQAEYAQEIPEAEQTQPAQEFEAITDNLSALHQSAPLKKPTETIAFDRREFTSESEQNDQPQTKAITHLPQDTAQKAKLPVWLLVLILSVLSLLVVVTYQLATTVTAMKSDIARLSALLDIVKDDVEALNQK